MEIEMTPNDWIATIKDVFVGGAAVTTAVVAVIGLNKWRKELEGKTEFDAARGLVKGKRPVNPS